MKHNYAIIILIIALMSSTSLAQDAGFGLGLMFGEPTGISGKIWINDIQAIDFGLGWTVGGFQLDRYDPNVSTGSRFHFHADFLWHNFDLIQTGERIPVYYGFGVRRNSGAEYDASYGLRGIIGVAWLPHSTPIDIFLEASPVFQLNPTSRFGINGGIGARYFL